ncbi:small metal-binding protein [Sulfolobus sp. A20]|uniref:DUF1059 domain-containing protein n=1 Tax=Sulfolobaceae TaxID=118883 RepID=UPI000845C45C|nr:MULTISPECIES: DUF1059 domain-containing protein [unclassified Sulfolobus]TRM74103.1 DUF1059 domain-containing protein [Sulfolobus sp. E5]TRM75813.1 DUF1059 domain-containing protein [Sulfolobus sp. A20-N-F8]TRM78623.1 DUF1059 domain-containing protein [Sulfolobus sp. B5]TRM80742.1 DUF1059 domain-containing protein [Sulfolobus sp. D5]TRM89707.1 DUF1059 domain-containing protein [Sulfolobus sp. C3]TRM92119.1 DUF1059 domain-containing protein [Sulfolobus sp. A20-N-G8]TRM99229.1 DUF1059 domai
MVFGLGKKKKFNFSCSSVGMNCGFEIRGASSEQELLEILKVHAKTVHNLSEIPDDVLNKIKQNIKKV